MIENKIIKSLTRPSFIVCISLLATAALGMGAAQEWLGWCLTKEPLPLRKSLEDMGKEQIGSYEIYSQGSIDNPDIVEQLGTKDYVKLVLEDPQVSKDSPVRYCNLFVTYYPLPASTVTHVPEECQSGSGSVLNVADKFSVPLSKECASKIAGMDNDKPQVPVKYLSFSKKDPRFSTTTTFGVMYFFKVNGHYSNDRNRTRFLGKNLLSKYSYFSKVEWQFFGQSSNRTIFPVEAEIIAASGNLMSTVLPMLENEYWPDWEKAKKE